jgi:hypothetical protein
MNCPSSNQTWLENPPQPAMFDGHQPLPFQVSFSRVKFEEFGGIDPWMVSTCFDMGIFW